jgi:hypothetical protein
MTPWQGSATIECNGWLNEGASMRGNSVAYAAGHSDQDSAMADLDALRELPDDDVIGNHDAAVIDQANRQPHIAKRVDRPNKHSIKGRTTLPCSRGTTMTSANGARAHATARER